MTHSRAAPQTIAHRLVPVGDAGTWRRWSRCAPWWMRFRLRVMAATASPIRTGLAGTLSARRRICGGARAWWQGASNAPTPWS